MIEFFMILPVFLIFTTLAVDAGRWMLLRSELQDATQQSARAGAQVGGAQVAINGSVWAQEVFELSAEGYGFDLDKVSPVYSETTCAPNTPYVQVSATYTVTTFVTPGLWGILKIVQPTQMAEGIKIKATSVALCEITPP